MSKRDFEKAVAVLFVRRGARGHEVLLLKRKIDGPEPGIFELPGGVAGADESRKSAAVKQIYEQINVQVEEVFMHKLARKSVHPHGSEARLVCVSYYLVVAEDNMVINIDEARYCGFVWMPMEVAVGFAAQMDQISNQGLKVLQSVFGR